MYIGGYAEDNHQLQMKQLYTCEEHSCSGTLFGGFYRANIYAKTIF